MIIKPLRLEPGQKIGIIAPGGPVKPSELMLPITILQDNGYQIATSPNLFGQEGYLSGDDESRLSDIHKMFEDKDIRAILCARGGYGSLRIIDRINYELIRNNPKIFIGYSDITALLLAIYNKTGLVVFHGPVARELDHQREDNLKNLKTFLSGDSPNVEITAGNFLKAGIAHGPVIGGNLSIIASLTGTPYMPAMAGCILFIEEKNESLYRIDRMLTQLRLNGLLDDLKGIVMGSFVDCGPMSDVENLLIDITKDFSYPILSGLPSGHGIDNRIIPLGIHGVIDTEKISITFKEEFFSHD